MGRLDLEEADDEEVEMLKKSYSGYTETLVLSVNCFWFELAMPKVFSSVLDFKENL